MAAAPLLVRLSPVPATGEKAILKLQAYFQSGKRSGGGECNVRTGPKPGTYWVEFFKEQGTGREPRLGLRGLGQCGCEGTGNGRLGTILRPWAGLSRASGSHQVFR